MRRALFCGLVLVPAFLPAQVRLEVEPYFASYYATTFTSYVSATENERQEAGPGLGVNVFWHLNRIVGVQASGTLVWSGIVPRQPQQAGTINLLTATPGLLTFSSVRLTVQPRRSNYFLAVGPALVHRSGDAWKVPGLDHLTNIGAVAALGIRASLNPNWQFLIGLNGHFYQSDPDGAASYYQSRLQRDVTLTIGVPISLVGR